MTQKNRLALLVTDNRGGRNHF